MKNKQLFINNREESQTRKERIAPSRKDERCKGGDEPGMQGTRQARASEIVRG